MDDTPTIPLSADAAAPEPQRPLSQRTTKRQRIVSLSDSDDAPITLTSLPVDSDLVQKRFRGLDVDLGETLDMGDDRVAITLAGRQPRFRVRQPLGQGGQGVVYAVEDVDCGRTVAVKTMIGDRHSAGHIARFIHETQVTAQLEHPGVVPVHDLGVLPNGVLYYAMKRISGSTLRDHLKKLRSDGRFRLFEVLQLFLKVCDAMQFAHDKGVVHRDLKPSNIMVGDYGEVLVLDWGLSLVLGQADVTSLRVDQIDDRRVSSSSYQTREGRAVGTPHYMSPEQACGEKDGLTPATDVYSLGVMLYEILCGKSPFHDVKNADMVLDLVVKQGWPRLQGGRKGMPKALVAITHKAMTYDPRQRYQSAKSLATDVQAFLANRSVSVHREQPIERLLRNLSRHRESVRSGLSVAVVALLLVVGALLFWAHHQRTEYQRLQREAAAYLAEQDYDQARRRYEQIIGRYPGDRVAQQALFEDLRRREQESEERERERTHQERRRDAAGMLSEVQALLAGSELDISVLERAKDRLSQAQGLVPDSATDLARQIQGQRDTVVSDLAQLYREQVAHSTRRQQLEQIGVLRQEARRLLHDQSYDQAASSLRAASALASHLGDAELNQQIYDLSASIAAAQIHHQQEQQRQAKARRLQDIQQQVLIAIRSEQLEMASGLLEQLRRLGADQVAVLELRQRIERVERQRAEQQAEAMLVDARRELAAIHQLESEMADIQQQLYGPDDELEERQRHWQLERRRHALETEIASRAAGLIAVLHTANSLAPDHAPTRRALAKYYAWRVQGAQRAGDRAAAAASAAEGRRFDDEQRHRLLFAGKGEITNHSGHPVLIEAVIEQADRRWTVEEPTWSLADGAAQIMPQGRYRVSSGPVRQGLLLQRGEQVELHLPVPPHLPEGVVLIPAGRSFDMAGQAVPVPAFALMQHEVTCGEYYEFISQARRERSDDAVRYPRTESGDGLWSQRSNGQIVLQYRRGRTIDANWPITGISIEDARAYAAWRRQRDGLAWRLPTHQEWRLALQGGDGRRFPWGNYPDLDWCYSSAQQPAGYGHIAQPVGSFPVDCSVQGVLDLSGSVAEFVDGSGSTRTGFALLCGGSWRDKDPARCSGAVERLIDERMPSDWIGFRLALDVP